MAYLDTREYYQLRQKFVEFCLLQRDYYHGHPYIADPVSFERPGTPSTLWQDFMTPSDDEPPAYIENSSREKIEKIAGRVWPMGSRVVFAGLEEELLEAVLDRLLYFADDYSPGLKGLDEWIEAVITDAPQVGDGLAMVQFVEGEARTRFMYHSAESWDVAMDTVRSEPRHYRIEFKLKEDDGTEVFRRWDIYRDSIQRFSSKPPITLIDNGKPPPARTPLAADPMVPLMPPKMHAIDNPDDAAERAVMGQLSDWIVAPLRWRRLAANEQRGAPEMMLNDLACSDQVNRLLDSWGEAAYSIGAPPIIARDCEFPSEAGGERKQLSKRDIGPGAVIEVTSGSPDFAADVFYPKNSPTTFPHSDVLDRLRTALAGNTPLTDPANISRFGELSGFAKDTLEEAYLQRVGRIRDRMFDNGIGRVLKAGIELLALKEAVPGLTLAGARKVKISFEFGGTKLSPDEQLKLVTLCSMLQKIGLPPNEVVAMLPFAPKDVKACVDALEQQAQEADMLAELELTMKAQPPANNKPQQPKPEGAGVDKRGQ